MKELGITKGEWQHFKFAKGNVEANGRSVANCMGYSNNTDAGKHIEENYANAELVIDAGNTAQKCGLLPSELLQQRDELREALKRIADPIGYMQDNLKEGERLDGIMALRISENAQYLKEIAEAAIKNTCDSCG